MLETAFLHLDATALHKDTIISHAPGWDIFARTEPTLQRGHSTALPPEVLNVVLPDFRHWIVPLFLTSRTHTPKSGGEMAHIKPILNLLLFVIS